MQEALFCQALGLVAPWEVERVALDVACSRIDLHVVWRANSAPCPACGAFEQKLDFFQFEAHVHCEPQATELTAQIAQQSQIITERDGDIL